MITKNDILKAIETLGLENSDICIHASLKSFKEHFESGISTITSAFLEKNCTIMMPVFSYDFIQKPIPAYMPKRNGITDYSVLLNANYNENKIFSCSSKELSEKDMGALSKFILNDSHSIRGNHPLNSFAALGNHASELVSSQTPTDVYAPFNALKMSDSYLLLMGTDLCSATLLHYAEQLAGRVPFIRWAKNPAGKTIPVSVGSCSLGFNNLYPHVKHLETRITIGQSVWCCYPVKAFLEAATAAIRHDPFITHCPNPNCERCSDSIAGGPIMAE